MPSNKYRLTISLQRKPAITATRVSIGKSKLVYVLVCDKKLTYSTGRSRVAYIGTTEKGIARISRSVAARADKILALRGVNEFEARIITCGSRQRVRTWYKLERAMLLMFRDMYGEVPVCNSHDKRIKETDEFDYFRPKRLRRILQDLA